MPVNDKITVQEYNNIRTKVVGILGPGFGNSGYGQLVRSSAVTAGNRVTINEWADLRFDIINAYVHQYGVNPNPVGVAEGDRIRYSVIDAPVPTYDSLATGIVNDKWLVGAGQSATNVPSSPASTTWPGLYGNFWTSKIDCLITVNWTTPNAARYFFNSGGQIRITSSRSGGSSTAQCNSWTSILSTAGTVSFGGNNPGTGTSPSDGQNWYRLTDSFQVYYSTFGSSPYGSNNYRISARTTDVSSNSTGTAAQSQFYVEFIDDYVDPGNWELDTPNTIDAIDGTFQVAVDLVYATGVLVPAGVGNFTVSLPSVAIGAIKPA